MEKTSQRTKLRFKEKLEVDDVDVWGFRSPVSHSVTFGTDRIVFGRGTQLTVDAGKREKPVKFDKRRKNVY